MKPRPESSPTVEPVVSATDDPGAAPEEGDGPPRRRLGRVPPRRSLSEILSEIAQDPTRERIAISDLLQAMPGRATAALLFLVSAPNVLPAPPGVSALLGLPMVYLALQLMLGRQPWLPRVIAARSFLRTDFARLMARALPWLARAERMLRPRLWLLVSPPAEVAIGALATLLALVVLLPIPLGNMLPSLSVCLLTLGILERDGLWAAIGAALGTLSLVIVSGVIIGGISLLRLLFANAFG